MGLSFKRKKYITKDPAQLKVLLLFLFSSLVPVFFVGSFFYALLFKIISDQSSTPGFVATSMDPTIRKTTILIVLACVPLLLLLTIWSIIFSHRLIGPLNRLKRELDSMVEKKDLTARLGVRKYDYIKPLVESINRLLDKASE